jgi:hypothetical protein
MKYTTYYTCTKCIETSRSALTHIYDADEGRTILSELSICCEMPVSVERVFTGSGRKNLKYMIDNQEKNSCPELSKCSTLYLCLECNKINDEAEKIIEVVRIGNQGYLILTKNKSLCCGDATKVLKNYINKEI